MQQSLIQKLSLYDFRLDHNTAEVPKYICYVNGEDTVNHSNKMAEEILLQLQELQLSAKVKYA